MKFVRESFKYSFKNFLRLLIMVLPLSIFVGFLNPYRTITFFSYYKNFKVSTYFDMLKATVSLSWGYLVIALISAVLFVVTISLVLSAMEYHMKTGRFSFAEAFRRFHYYIFPVLTLSLLFILFFVVLCFLLPAICYFVHYMLAGLHKIPTKTTYFVCLIICLFGYFIAFLALVVFMVAVNLIAINSYSLKSAILNALNLLEGKFFKYLFAVLSPYIIIVPVMLLVGDAPYYPAITTILFALQMIFSLSLCMISYFKFTKTARKDNPTGYFVKGVK